MNFAAIKYNVIEDGEGCRTALFVSGCRHHCKGCFQPQTWDFNFGEKFTPEIEDKILESMSSKHIAGITILGGEPFEPENQHALYPFILKIKNKFPDKTIWMYSGYTFEELTNKTKSCHVKNITKHILENIDVLIDGEFIENLKDLTLAYRGSSNQRIILTKESINNNKIVFSKYMNGHL